ncbi:hypothetical protein [Streptomyces nanshensis]|uniref:hypothetical protein n=1 Tax=Streptomyces nanshensis TaxID=518642 RepID=UPI00085C1DF9|nr:hypothetical protein [Streptomyces nanshensis]
MSGQQGRVGRSYTKARRYPWVLGKIGDWTLPLGPYTPAQIAIAFFGGFLLIKTFSLWSWMGPVPVLAWAVAIWGARRASIGGRAPGYIVLGLVNVALQPRAGRIGGRAVREPKPRVLTGGFYIREDGEADDGPRRGRRRGGGAVRPEPTALQQLLASAGAERGGRS